MMIVELKETRRSVRQLCSTTWCPEEDTRDYVRARRNVMTGLWAGHLMGLEGSRLNAYAAEVHFADYEEVGDGDVIRKIASDLRQAGLAVEETRVRSQLSKFHRDAWVQTLVTD